MSCHLSLPRCRPFSVVLATAVGLLAIVGGFAWHKLSKTDVCHVGFVSRIITLPAGRLMSVTGPLDGWVPAPVAVSLLDWEGVGEGDWIMCFGRGVKAGDRVITRVTGYRTVPLSHVLPENWRLLVDKNLPGNQPVLGVLLGLLGLLPILHRPLFRIVFAVGLALAGMLALGHLAILLEFAGWIDLSTGGVCLASGSGMVLGASIALGGPCAVRMVMQRFFAVAVLMLVQAGLAQALFGGGDNLVRVLLIMVCLISPAAALAAVSAYLIHLGIGDHPMNFFAFLFTTLVIVVAVDKRGPSLLLPRLGFLTKARSNGS